MKHQLHTLTLGTACLTLAAGCQLFGGDDDSMADENMSEDANLLANASEEYNETYNEAGEGDLYSDDTYSEDAGGDNYMGMGDDTAIGNNAMAAGNYSDNPAMADVSAGAGNAGLSSGNVFFITTSVSVISSPDASGSAVFSLHAGDSVRAEVVGDYAMIGAGHYVPASALSQTVVERTPEANPWR